MPLLTCPNDNAPMQAVARQGVELDICPQCRGVWLDRGELEKLMGAVRVEADGAPAAAAYQEPRPQPRPESSAPRQYAERGEFGERGEYGERGYGASGQHRKKRFDIFDIFD